MARRSGVPRRHWHHRARMGESDRPPAEREHLNSPACSIVWRPTTQRERELAHDAVFFNAENRKARFSADDGRWVHEEKPSVRRGVDIRVRGHRSSARPPAVLVCDPLVSPKWSRSRSATSMASPWGAVDFDSGLATSK